MLSYRQVRGSRRFAAGLVLLFGVLPVLVAACATSRPGERPARRSATVDVREPVRPLGPRLYATDEALEDALSGEWEYLGTGRWPGVDRSHACAFRNGRVLIVNVYCTVTETQAFRIDVYSPERGRVRIYAEANGPVSRRKRTDYFIFTAESEPPPEPEAGVGAVDLAMSFDELRRYDQARYDAFLPGCYGGERHAERVGGCLGALAPRAPEWAAQNRAFLEDASADWYRVVREMRSLAGRYGRDPK